jgi:hypothetical protein
LKMKYRLFAPMRHDLFQRDESRRRGQQVQNEPVQTDIADGVVTWAHLDRATTQISCNKGEHDAQCPQPLLAVEQEGQQAESGGEHHARREQLAHQAQIVAGPQRWGGQVVGEHEAQHR